MNEPAILLFMAILGSVAGAFSGRFPASGRIALLLPLIPAFALGSIIGRG